MQWYNDTMTHWHTVQTVHTVHLLKKALMENFFLCNVQFLFYFEHMEITEPLNCVFSVERTDSKEDDSDSNVSFKYLWIVGKLLLWKEKN